jgi:hypothetical protein
MQLDRYFRSIRTPIQPFEPGLSDPGPPQCSLVLPRDQLLDKVQLIEKSLDMLHNSSRSFLWQEYSCGFDKATLYGGHQTQASVNAIIDDANYRSETIIV